MISRLKHLPFYIILSAMLLTVACIGQNKPTNQLTPTAPPDPKLQLSQLIKEIHDPYEIDPTQGCYELQSPYEGYHQDLQKITAVLLTHPLAQSLSLAEREALFTEVVGFDGIQFIPGNSGAVLVTFAINRGKSCSPRYQSPNTFYVVDTNGNISDIGTEGLYKNSWQFDDRWVILSKLKLDSTSGPTPWVVWHIEQTAEGKWQQTIRHEFAPTPYNFDSLDLRFENGVTTLIADLEYWWQDDPCQFSAEFQETYAHGDWKTQETYVLVDGAYQRTDVQIIDFPIIDKATQTSVTLTDWQTNCLSPLFSN